MEGGTVEVKTVNNSTSWELLRAIDGRLRGQNILDRGSGHGLIDTARNSQAGSFAGIGEFDPSTDDTSQLNPAESVINRRPMANKRRARTQPETIHIVVGQGDHLFGSTGLVSQRTLGRLTVAMSCVAAELSASELNIVMHGRSEQPRVIHEIGSTPNLTHVMSVFGVAANSPIDIKAGQNPSKLADSLKVLDNRGLDSRTDAVVVADDFVLGGQYNNEELAVGFEWLSPLRALHARLGDRLFAVRLKTPAQQLLPQEEDYEEGGDMIDMNFGGSLDASLDYYIKGSQKDELITRFLSPIRHIDLSTVDEYPISSLAAFLFDVPEAA